MKTTDNRIQYIKNLLFFLAEQKLWFIKVGRFEGDTGNFFIPTERGKSLIGQQGFEKIMENVSSGAELLIYYCGTTSEHCTLKQSRDAIKRFGAWLIDTIQLYQESPNMSELDCWIEAEKVAVLVFSKKAKWLSQTEVNLLLRYFTRKDIMNHFKIPKADTTRFVAEYYFEECSVN